MFNKDAQGRPMKYPYTLSAKIAQFPFKHYIDNAWGFKYFLISAVVCLPIFYKIQKLSYSPANVEKWSKAESKKGH